jgi:hypothetical protein
MFAKAYMGRKGAGEAPSTLCLFSGLTNERLMTDWLSVSSTQDRVSHTPDFLCSLVGSAHAALSRGRVQEIRGISIVFREMWDTTVLDAQLRWLSLERRSHRPALPPK